MSHPFRLSSSYEVREILWITPSQELGDLPQPVSIKAHHFLLESGGDEWLDQSLLSHFLGVTGQYYGCLLTSLYERPDLCRIHKSLGDPFCGTGGFFTTSGPGVRQWPSFPNTIYRRDYPFPIVYSWLLCHKLTDHVSGVCF